MSGHFSLVLVIIIAMISSGLSDLSFLTRLLPFQPELMRRKQESLVMQC